MKRRICIWMDKERLELLKREADRRGVPYVDVIRLAIDLYFQFQPPLKKIETIIPTFEKECPHNEDTSKS